MSIWCWKRIVNTVCTFPEWVKIPEICTAWEDRGSRRLRCGTERKKSHDPFKLCFQAGNSGGWIVLSWRSSWGEKQWPGYDQVFCVWSEYYEERGLVVRWMDLEGILKRDENLFLEGVSSLKLSLSLSSWYAVTVWSLTIKSSLHMASGLLCSLLFSNSLNEAHNIFWGHLSHLEGAVELSY